MKNKNNVSNSQVFFKVLARHSNVFVLVVLYYYIIMFPRLENCFGGERESARERQNGERERERNIESGR